MTTTDDLIGLSDWAWQRTRGRLEGLTDEEYFWEPAPDCWTVRRRRSGAWNADYVEPTPAPAPLTTIAWRMWHLTDCYGGERNARFLRVEPAPAVTDKENRSGSAAAAIGLLSDAHDRWRLHLTSLRDDVLPEKLGPVAGPYADDTLLAFALHMLDEFIHHGAEIAVLRDVYRATHAPEAAAAAPPRTVAEAAARGRWDLVVDLVEAGSDVNGLGSTALHQAAGIGDLDVVRVFVERGADTTVKDPQFDATPLGWAEFFGQREVVAYLSALEGSSR
jgi:hypothetical protein